MRNVIKGCAVVLAAATIGLATAGQAVANEVDGGGSLLCKANREGDQGEVIISARSLGTTEVSWNGQVRHVYEATEHHLRYGKAFYTGLSRIDSWRVVGFNLQEHDTQAYCGWR
jgi:hypothetical protein